MHEKRVIFLDEIMTKFTAAKAKEIGKRIGIDWTRVDFDVEQLRMGLSTELEHGKRDPRTNISNDDLLVTGKIAWSHLMEIPDYYTRLEKMEKEGKASARPSPAVKSR
jgi:hypothetical protein